MLAAGIGIPILATFNAALGPTPWQPAAAAVVLFVIAFSASLIVTLLTVPGALGRIAGHPPQLYLAGLLVAFYVLSITWVAPTFGVGNAVFFVLLGQLLSAAIIDHFALMGARLQPLTLMRASGIALMACGVLLTQHG